jgi:hypothetical protein
MGGRARVGLSTGIHRAPEDLSIHVAKRDDREALRYAN